MRKFSSVFWQIRPTLINLLLGMEGRNAGPARGPTISGEESAIAVASALFTFLLATKFSLLLWHLFVKGSRPLADVPADGVLYLAGFDLLLCLGLAVVFSITHLL